jgi:hypothetical protein
LAQELFNRLGDDQSGPFALIDTIRTRLGEAHRLSRVLTKGIAFHHSALPTDVQAEIEDAVRRGEIAILVATTTLTEGVNLPFKTVVIAHRGYWGTDGDWVELIDAPRLLNAIGRAGRAGRETEGWLILSELSRPFNQEMFGELARTGEEIELRSTLADDAALDALARIEQAVLSGEDAILSNTDAIADGFISYVWFIADALEALHGQVTVEAVLEAIADTLAWHQLDDASQNQVRRAAAMAFERFEAQSSATRRRWARSGTSLGSAAKLENLSNGLVQACVSETGIAGLTGALELVIADGRLETVLNLAENQKRGFKLHRNAPKGQLIDVDISALVRGWIAGLEVQTLADQYLGSIADSDYRYEQLHEFIASVFEHHLPWTFGILIAWANASLEETGSLLRLPESLPGAIHFGVGSTQALEFMLGGVRSRRLANRVATVRQETVPTDDDETMRAWLASKNLTDWRDEFQASPTELLDLLAYTRAPEARLVSEVLAGNGYQIRFVQHSAVEEGAEVSIEMEAHTPMPARLLVYLNATIVGEIAPQHYEDVRMLREIGVPLTVTVVRADDGQALEIRLGDEAT